MAKPDSEMRHEGTAKKSLSWLEGRVVAPRGALVCLLVLWAVLVLGQVTPCIDMNADTARYLVLARSLAEGRGYTLEGVLCRSYPPLFPLALRTVADRNRRDFRPERLIVALTGLGALLGSYWLLCQRHDARTAAVLAMLVAVSPPFVRYCGQLRSDVPFMLLATVFLAAMDRFWRARSLDWCIGLVGALALPAAALTRSAGLVFYLAAAAWLARPSLWRRGRRGRALFAAVALLAAAVPAAIWTLWVTVGQSGTVSYWDFLARRTQTGGSPSLPGSLAVPLFRMVRYVPGHLADAGSTIVEAGKGGMAPYWAALFLPVLGLGLARRMRRPGAADYGFCGYCLLVLLWPVSQGTRLWLPVLPLMLSYLAEGAACFGRIADEFPGWGRCRWVTALDAPLGRARRPVTHAAVVLLLVLGLASGLGRVAACRTECRQAVGGVLLRTDPLDVARFLNSRGGEQIVLAYDRFREVAPAITNPDCEVVDIPRVPQRTARALLDELARARVTHLAIQTGLRDPLGRHRALPEARELLLADPDRYPIAHQTGRLQVFRLAPPAGAR